MNIFDKINSITRKTAQVWGIGFLTVVSFYGLYRLLKQPIPGHFRIFVGAAKALWQGTSPHRTTFDTGVGLWFYSPSCGLFFFGPLSLLPEKLGLIVYMGVSWLTFVGGATSLLKAATKSSFRPIFLNFWTNLFWFGITPQVFSAILASKLELIMVGILFWVASQLISLKRFWASGMLLSLILNWKFQPLPTIGLIGAIWLVLGQSLSLLVALVVGSLAWLAIPIFVIPYSTLLEIYKEWNEKLSSFVGKAWFEFDNIFSFIKNAMHIELSYLAGQVLGLCFGFVLLGFTVFWVLQRRKILSKRQVLTEGMLFALAAGATFSVMFSPLSQNNGFVIYAPVWLMTLMTLSFEMRVSSLLRKKVMSTLVVVFWFTMTFAYSDLFPSEMRGQIRHISVKAFCCFLMLIFNGVIVFLHRQSSLPLWVGWKFESGLPGQELG